jgi:hypothetical protein
MGTLRAFLRVLESDGLARGADGCRSDQDVDNGVADDGMFHHVCTGLAEKERV